MEKKTFYDLNFKKYALIELLSFIVSVVSLTLLRPLILFYQYKIEAESTYIEGKQLKFKGKLIELYIIYFVWLVITIIIVDIYQYVSVLLLKEIKFDLSYPIYYLITTSMITFLSATFIKGAFRRWKYRSTYHINEKLYYKGHIIWLIITTFIRKILNILSVGIFYPLIKDINFRYEVNRIQIGNRKLEYQSCYKKINKLWFKNILKIIFTLGIYIIFIQYLIKKELIESITIKEKNQ